MSREVVRREHDRVRLDRSHGGTVAWLVMERGDGPANAFNAEMVDGMTATLLSLPRETGCLVLRGDREFSVGADLRAVADAPVAERPAVIDAIASASNRFIRGLRAVEVPTVAAVNGTAAGGGLGFALACDVVVMHEAAAMDPAYARVGLTPDNATPFYLARTLGPYRARELLFSPRAVSAEEARELGLITQLFDGDAEGFDQQVGAYAADLGQVPSTVHGVTKTLVDTAFTDPLEDHLERERVAIKRAADSPVFAEGLAAFFENRTPDWPARADTEDSSS